MSSSHGAEYLGLVAVVFATLFGTPRLLAQETGLAESIRAALARYPDLDPLAVTWSQATEVTALGREKLPPKVRESMINRGEKVLQLAFRGGRMYLRRETRGGSSNPPTTSEIAFDRKVLYGGAPGNAHDPRGRPSLNKWLARNDQPEANYFNIDYFRAVGIRLPTRVKDLVAPWRPQCELPALLAEGGRVEATGPANLDRTSLVWVRVTARDWRLQGVPSDLSGLERRLRAKGITEEEVQRRLAVARKLQERRAPERRYDFYLDPQASYAIRRLDTSDEFGHLVVRSECAEHEQLIGRAVWLPQRCRVEHYTYGDLRDQKSSLPLVFASPLYVDKFRLTTFDLEPWPDDRFELKYTTPGTLINDATLPEAKGRSGALYEVPASPARLDEVIQAARARTGSRLMARKSNSSVVILVLNGMLLVVVAVYFVLRRRKLRNA